jgi:hypothetical protein
MEVALFTVNEAAATPPNLTELAPVRFVPVITTVAPLEALLGLNVVMVGAAAEIKVNPLTVTVPTGVVTLTLPLAPLPTTATIVMALTTLNDLAAVPPKLTELAPVKLVPVMVTIWPLRAEVGAKEAIVGGLAITM